MFHVHQRVIVTKGHYKGRPALIQEINADGTYTVTLTDTPELNDVVIKRLRSSEMRAQ